MDSDSYSRQQLDDLFMKMINYYESKVIKSIQYYDDEPDNVEYTLVATYKIYRHETKDSKFMKDKI